LSGGCELPRHRGGARYRQQAAGYLLSTEGPNEPGCRRRLPPHRHRGRRGRHRSLARPAGHVEGCDTSPASSARIALAVSIVALLVAIARVPAGTNIFFPNSVIGRVTDPSSAWALVGTGRIARVHRRLDSLCQHGARVDSSFSKRLRGDMLSNELTAAMSRRLASPNVPKVAIAIAAFIAYAVMTVGVRAPDQPGSYAIERTSTAAAVSNIVYGAPVGSVYSNLYNSTRDINIPVEPALKEANTGMMQPGVLIDHGPDGIGFGYILYATAAMRVFGMSTLSLLLGFLSLMFVSTVLFLLRYRDDRAVVIPISFFSLTLMLATPIGTDISIIDQIPVGGYRYFSLLAIIPAIHIMLEIWDRPPANSPIDRFRIFLLILQVILFVFVSKVNFAVMYFFVPFAISVAYLAWKRRASALKKSGLVVGLVAALSGMFLIWMPTAYKEKWGDLFWHRVFISVGMHPAFPFGNFGDAYVGCQPWAPARNHLVPGIADSNGGCVWFSYAQQRGMSLNQASAQLYDSEYEQIERQALFRVARLYPRETMEAFLYYKWPWLGQTILAYAKLDFLNPCIFLVMSLQGGLLALFGVFCLGGSPPLGYRTISAIFAGSAASTIPLYLVAWSNIFTTADLCFYPFAFVGLAIAAAFDSLRRLARANARPRNR
jgi:hypothetical protein